MAIGGFKITADEEVPSVQRNPEAWHALFKVMYGISYAAQVGHWNLIDPRFNDLHSFFGSEYDSYSDHVDTIAEHIRQHGSSELLPMSLPQLAEGLKPLEPTSEASTLLDNLCNYINVASNLIVKLNGELKHPADVDLLGELSRAVSKSIWKLDSIRGKKA